MTHPSRRRTLSRIFAYVGNDRAWSLIGGLSVRVSGFVASFVLARFSGAHVLGQYSTVVNTAGTVATPVLTMLTSASTFQASRQAEGMASMFTLMRVYMRIALQFAALACVAFGVMYLSTELVHSDDNAILALAICAGISSVVGQIVAYTLQGICFGSGQFKVPALVGAIVSAVATGAVALCAVRFGVVGAFGVLLISAAAHPAALAVWAMRRHDATTASQTTVVMAAARTIIRSSIPLIGSTIVASIANWISMILLVSKQYGAAGVGVIAVGAQWTTLLVLAVTSWGGVTMRTLTEATTRGRGAKLRYTVMSLILKHLVVTGIGCALVVYAAGLVASAYGAEHTPLALVLRINALVALVLACSNVFDRLLFCLGAQAASVRASMVGSLVQVIVVLAALDEGLEVAALAVLVGSFVTLLQCLWVARPYLRSSRK